MLRFFYFSEMKTQWQIRDEILDFAVSDENIRAVLLEGSRANPNAVPDEYQDYDVVFVVSNFEKFISDGSWTERFGEKLIEQHPETFTHGEKTEHFFSYLIIYREGFRIDFSVIPVAKLDLFKESLRKVWLDKDGLFEGIEESSDQKYWIRKPDEKWFLEVCNEFWWVSTYVAKGLKRNEIPYAMKHLEEILRPSLMQMLDWKIGTEHDFKVSAGKSGKFYPKYLGAEKYEQFLKTYVEAKPEEIWNVLFLMSDMFSETAKNVAERLAFRYNAEEENSVVDYLKDLREK